jgi:hypothetical protein
MSFDIAATPTLQAVATLDEQLLAQDLQARLFSAIEGAQGQPQVSEALQEQFRAQEKLARLRKAERVLSLSAQESREQTAASAETAMDAIIESAASIEKPDFKKLTGLASAETQQRYTGRAIERIVEHLIPLAQIASLRAESQALLTRARAVETIAQDRAEKVLAQIRGAVKEEMVLPIDMSKGVAGALLTHSAGLKRCALQVSQNADELERSYADRNKLAGYR